MTFMFAITGIAFQVMAIVLDVYLRKTVEKRAGKIADMYLSEYNEDEIVPEAIAKEFIKKGSGKILSVFAIPVSLRLIGAVLLIIYVIIRR